MSKMDCLLLFALCLNMLVSITAPLLNSTRWSIRMWMLKKLMLKLKEMYMLHMKDFITMRTSALIWLKSLDLIN